MTESQRLEMVMVLEVCGPVVEETPYTAGLHAFLELVYIWWDPLPLAYLAPIHIYD